jgi:hypothetical protein
MNRIQPESKRIRKFREELIRNIPRSPNNAETLAALEAKSLGELLIVYINNAARFVPPRPRSIVVEPTVTQDSRWRSLSRDAKQLFEKARAGVDLTPNLSLKIHKEGFSLAATSSDPEVRDKWADKDFLLNVMGYHHFHLSHDIEKKGHAKRTNDVLFAQLTRNNFIAIGFFDHSVFESSPHPSDQMSAERERLWQIFQARSSRGIPPGAAYMPWSISTSGHCTHHVFMASRYARTIASIDPMLEDASYLKANFRAPPNNGAPEKYRLSWRLEFLDLGVYDEVSNVFCVAEKGPL